jgi:putative ABC transport system permease protein
VAKCPLFDPRPAPEPRLHHGLAGRLRVLGELLVQNLVLPALGCACGVLAAFWGLRAAFALTRYVTSILFDIQPYDPATLVSAIGILIVAGLAATLIPARRAMCVDPINVLRSE